jgi:hypothetical protein
VTLALNAAWLAAARDRSPTFRGYVELAISPAARLRLFDWSVLPGSGATVSFLGYTVTEGVEWTASGSNNTTALSIIAALKATAGGGPMRFHVTLTATLDAVIDGYGGATPAFSVFGAGAAVELLTNTPSSVKLGFSDSTFHDTLSATDIVPYPPIVHEIRGLEVEMDPVERGAAFFDVEIVVADDGLIRTLMQRQILLGKAVTIWTGFEGLDVATEFEQWPTLRVVGLEPSPDKSTITIRCESRAIRLRDRKLSNLTFTNIHPMEAAVVVMTECGMTTADYDVAAWDATVTAAQGHYNLSRRDDETFDNTGAIRSPISALDAFNSLLQILGGTARMAQDGKLTYVPYDYSAAPVRAFSNSDNVHNAFPCEVTKHSDCFDLLFNRVVVNYLQSRGAGSLPFEIEDAGSVLETGTARELVIDSDWLSQLAIVEYYHGVDPDLYDFTGSYPTGTAPKILALGDAAPKIVIAGAARSGFCGTRIRWNGASFSGPAAAYSLSPTRPSYILIFGETTWSVLAFDEATTAFNYTGSAFGAGSGPLNTDVDGVTKDGEMVPHRVQFVGAANYYNDNSFSGGWNGFGTSATEIAIPNAMHYPKQYYPGAQAVDVTIVSEIARRALERFRYGAPRLTIRTTIEHFDLELGDVVSFSSDDVLLAPLVDGTSTACTFEIVAKRCRFFEDAPSMEFDLVLLKATAQEVFDVVTTYPPVIVIAGSTEPDELTTNDGDPIWTDFDGDGTIEVGDSPVYKG